MTSANEMELVRVYTSLTAPPNSIGDDSIKSNEQFRVVIEAEAGSALHNNGGPYLLKIDVLDLTASATVATTTQAGTFNDANWPDFKMEFAFPPIAAQGAAKENHVYEVVGVVTAGGTDPIVDFARSDLFIITKP